MPHLIGLPLGIAEDAGFSFNSIAVTCQFGTKFSITSKSPSLRKLFQKVASEVTSSIEEANKDDILQCYDNGEDEEWPEETDESGSNFEHRDSLSIAQMHENRQAGPK